MSYFPPTPAYSVRLDAADGTYDCLESPAMQFATSSSRDTQPSTYQNPLFWLSDAAEHIKRVDVIHSRAMTSASAQTSAAAVHATGLAPAKVAPNMTPASPRSRATLSKDLVSPDHCDAKAWIEQVQANPGILHELPEDPRVFAAVAIDCFSHCSRPEHWQIWGGRRQVPSIRKVSEIVAYHNASISNAGQWRCRADSQLLLRHHHKGWDNALRASTSTQWYVQLFPECSQNDKPWTKKDCGSWDHIIDRRKARQWAQDNGYSDAEDDLEDLYEREPRWVKPWRVLENERIEAEEKRKKLVEEEYDAFETAYWASQGCTMPVASEHDTRSKGKKRAAEPEEPVESSPRTKRARTGAKPASGPGPVRAPKTPSRKRARAAKDDVGAPKAKRARGAAAPDASVSPTTTLVATSPLPSPLREGKGKGKCKAISPSPAAPSKALAQEELLLSAGMRPRALSAASDVSALTVIDVAGARPQAMETEAISSKRTRRASKRLLEAAEPVRKAAPRTRKAATKARK